MLKFILLNIISLNLFAYTPTVESLFRNSENRDIEKNTVIISFKVKALDEITNKTEKLEGDSKNENKEVYAKYYFNLENQKRTRLITSYYNTGSMRASQAQGIRFIQNAEEYYRTGAEQSLSSVTLHSLIQSLVINKTDSVIELFKSCSPNIKKNKEVLNKEKIYLYERYKNYLITIKDEPSLKESLQNPLESENPEEQEKIKEIQSSSFYQTSENVKLVREGDQFLVEFKEPGLRARFSNGKHRLRDLALICDNQELLLEFSDYLLFNGVHELPKYIYFKVNERSYLLQFLNVRHLSLQPGKFMEVFRGFQEKSKKTVSEALQIPEILI